MPPSRPATIDKLSKLRRSCVNSACAEVQRFFPRTSLLVKELGTGAVEAHPAHLIAPDAVRI
jgi:hypothetical protein